MAHFCEQISVVLRQGSKLTTLCKKVAGHTNASSPQSRCLTTTSSDTRVLRSTYPEVPIPDKTFVQLIWERHNQWANKTAVECSVTGTSYTYEMLLDRAESVGSGLLQSGAAARGQVLAFLLNNSPDYIAAVLGASWAGLTVCSLNPLYTPDEIAYQLKNSGAKSIVTFPGKVGDVLQAVQQLTADGIVTSDFQVISTREGGTLPKGVRSLEEVARMNGGGPSAGLPELAFIAHSSGTTGLPKGVCLTQHNVTASIVQFAHQPTTVFRETTSSFQDVIPLFLPIFHNFGLEIALQALYHGSKIVTLPKFEENLFLSSFQKHKGTLLFAAPPVVLYMGQQESVRTEHFEHLRAVLAAAAPLAEGDVLRCLSKTPHHTQFIQAYGQTEAFCCLTFTPYGMKKPKYSSVGIPVVNTQIKINDIQSGEANPEFKEGELVFKGPQTCAGYLNNPKATEEALDKEDWFHTGDIGYYDSDGHLYIVDRIKELIKVKGFQVAPAELEAVLRNHPGVEDAAVTGMPDERKGEVPVGFIKVKSQEKLTEQDLKDFLSKKVAPFKMISTYIFVDSIPKSPSGKILRKDLKLILKKLNKM